jgi:hypothetical protein
MIKIQSPIARSHKKQDSSWFSKKKILQGGTLSYLLLQRILLEFEGKKIFFKWKSKW